MIMSDTLQKIQELEDKVAELKAQYEAEQKMVRWEPKGGNWTLYPSISSASLAASMDKWRLGGLERDNEEQAKRAAIKLRKYARLLAWVDEYGGVKEFKLNKSNHTIYYDYKDKEFRVTALTYMQDITGVYMTKEQAELLAEKLNSGEVVL